MQPLEQHRRPSRVGPQEPYGAAPVPVPQREVLVLRLVLREGDLQDGGDAVGSAHRQHERAEAVHRRAVRGELPLVEQLAHPARQPVEEAGERLAARGVRTERGRQLDSRPVEPVGTTYFLPLSPGPPSEESAAMKASWGTSTRPTIFIRFLPSFCFSSSLRLRVMSPP